MPSEKQIDRVRGEIGAILVLELDADTSSKAFRQAVERILRITAAEPAPAALSGAVWVRQLEWEETHSRRSDEDPTTEWNGGFEAESALGFYEISMGFGSDAYYWSVTNPLGDDVGSNFEDPLYAKAAAQADYEQRILSALEPAEPATNTSGLLQQMREMADAFAAMRNDLNELFPIQSDEADLLQGPEFSVACAAIVEAARKRTAEYVLLQLHMKPMSEIAAHWKERAETAEARLQSAEEVVKVLAAFVPYYAPWMDHHDDEVALSFYRPATFGDLRAAHRILSALKLADPTKDKDQ